MVIPHAPHAIDRAIATSPAFRAGARVLVAVSGGPDSMALLAAAAQSSAHIVAAHFDHRIREDSARDVETVRAFADAHGIEVVAGSGDVPATARSAKVSIETAAREARYAFLSDTASRSSCSWIATAHTRSDHVETVLMRILRGAGERGLAGIARARHGVVRPLLDVTRAEVLDYCASRGIPFVIDPSNADRRYSRNAVRHDVLPALRRAFTGIDDALLRTSRLAGETLNSVRAVTDGRLDRLRAKHGAWVLPVDAFAGLDEVEASILIGDVMERIGCIDDITAVHYQSALALTCEGRVGASASLPGVTVRRDHDALVLRTGPAEATTTPRATRLEVPGSVRMNGWKVTAEFDAGPVVVVRTPRAGDRIRPRGMSGTKKLSDVFIDSKIPHRERASAVVVEVDGEIVLVPGVVAAARAGGVSIAAEREEAP